MSKSDHVKGFPRPPHTLVSGLCIRYRGLAGDMIQNLNVVIKFIQYTLLKCFVNEMII